MPWWKTRVLGVVLLCAAGQHESYEETPCPDEQYYLLLFQRTGRILGTVYSEFQNRKGVSGNPEIAKIQNRASNRASNNASTNNDDDGHAQLLQSIQLMMENHHDRPPPNKELFRTMNEALELVEEAMQEDRAGAAGKND